MCMCSMMHDLIKAGHSDHEKRCDTGQEAAQLSG